MIEWFQNQTTIIKAILITLFSIILYVIFRYLIHLVNKDYKNLNQNKKKLSYLDNLKSLAG
jgi:hypothetical protein